MLSTVRAASVAATIAILGALIMASPAAADPPVGCDPNAPRCDIVIVDPGEEPGDPAPDPETGVTPGPAECLHRIAAGQYEKVPCTSDKGSWSNASQCYWRLMDPQTPPPPGADPLGAWYECSGFEWFNTASWLTTPPPGLGLTPAQAAARIMQTMTFQGINMGMAPELNPRLGYRRGFVGVPVWLWAANQNAQNWGPYVVTATLGGQSITVTANVTSVLWNMGDGTTVPCTAGTPYSVGYGVTESPTCGHRYTTTSDTNGGRYTVTATSQWSVNWTGGGQSGTIPITAQSTDNIWIDEMQSVNVPGN